MPLLADIFAALMAASVRTKMMERIMQASITLKRRLILINVHKLNVYVFLMALMSFQVVKIHHGSRTRASQGRVRRLTLDPVESWLK